MAVVGFPPKSVASLVPGYLARFTVPSKISLLLSGHYEQLDNFGYCEGMCGTIAPSGLS